jgi:hypothetical protein
MTNVTDPARFMHLASKRQCYAAAEMADDIKAAIHKHDDKVSLALALGVLEIVKKELIESND